MNCINGLSQQLLCVLTLCSAAAQSLLTDSGLAPSPALVNGSWASGVAEKFTKHGPSAAPEKDTSCTTAMRLHPGWPGGRMLVETWVEELRPPGQATEIGLRPPTHQTGGRAQQSSAAIPSADGEPLTEPSRGCKNDSCILQKLMAVV